MAGYVPLFTPGQSVPRTAASDVVGGRLLQVAGDDTVEHAEAGSTSWSGVAGFDVKAGDRVTTYRGGVQRLVAAGAINAGDVVAAAADGKAAAYAGTDPKATVGVAETSAADGDTVEVAFNR